jgi:phosphopantothenoylcysteine synthetase/decarboxylase
VNAFAGDSTQRLEGKKHRTEQSNNLTQKHLKKTKNETIEQFNPITTEKKPRTEQSNNSTQ